MDTITKTKPSEETLRETTALAFPDCSMIQTEELTEGFFNTAYCITLSDGRDVVLKISPHAGVPIMTYEKNIVFTETDCMRIVKNRTDVPVPDLLFFDPDRLINGSRFFFMSKIPGHSLNKVAKELNESELADIQQQAGRWNAQINEITGTKFGYYSQPDRQVDNWFTVFSSMISDVFRDAKVKNIFTGLPPERAFSLLSRDRKYFDEVTVPVLVHWDLWAGNIFVNDGKISGIIDFERCLWADPLMEAGFRTNQQNKNFLRGYGLPPLTFSQKLRVLWYDLYLFLTQSLETDYRGYPNRDLFIWATENVRATEIRLESIR